MLISVLILSALPLIRAQYGGGSSPSSSSAAASTTVAAAAVSTPSDTHIINVGQGGLVFSPNNITAAVGDTVQFRFFSSPAAHSVAQGNFSSPCQPLDTGFFSGFLSGNSDGTSNEFTVTINDTNPIWYYCSQTTGSHCQQGMVGVINPPTDGSQTLDQYKSAASSAGNSNSQPGVQGGVVGTVAAVSASSSSSTSATASAGSSKSDATVLQSSVLAHAMVCALAVLTGALMM